MNQNHLPEYLELRSLMIPMGPHIPERVLKELQAGAYEDPELNAIDLGLNKDDIVMELGTGLGVVSAFCSKRVGSKRVFTFEADPALKPHIEHLHSVNQVSPELNFCVLGHQEGDATFYRNYDFRCSSTIPMHGAQPVTVQVRSFELELRRILPTLLIVDIEGGEYELLLDSNLDTVRKVIIEIHGRTLGREKTMALLDFFRVAGFRTRKTLLDTKRRIFYELEERFGTKSILMLRKSLSALGAKINAFPLMQEVLLLER